MELIDKIKNYLLKEFDYETWKDFVDNQNLGDCQNIVYFITQEFPQVEKVLCEIEIDNSYINENGDEQIYMTHHCVRIDGDLYEFSAGTLQNYINFDDLYEVKVIDDYRYTEL